VVDEGREKQKQVPIRLRSGQAFGFAEKRFAQDDTSVVGMTRRGWVRIWIAVAVFRDLKVPAPSVRFRTLKAPAPSVCFRTLVTFGGDGPGLLSKDFGKGGEGRGQSGRRDGTQAADETDFVDGSNLIEEDKPVFARKPDRNAKRSRMISGGHWRHDDSAQVVVHLRRGDDHAGARFLNFAPDSGVESREPDLAALHTS